MCYDTGKGGSNMEKRKSWVVVLLGILLVLKIFVSCEYYMALYMETISILFIKPVFILLGLISVDFFLTMIYINLSTGKRFGNRLISYNVLILYLIYAGCWIIIFFTDFQPEGLLSGLFAGIIYCVPVVVSVTILVDFIVHIVLWLKNANK